MEPESFIKGWIKLYCGDSAKIIKNFPDNHFHSIVCDPPYALVSIVKRFGKTKESDDTKTSQRVRDRADGYARLAAGGFMGKKWDTGETAFAIEFWQECLRILKPGGHVVAFGGTRTYHRLAGAIEDAGFEIRDQLQYLYGSGFPKSHDISKVINVCKCEEVSERRVRSMPNSDVPETKYIEKECGEVLFQSMPKQSLSIAGRSEYANNVWEGKPSMEGRSDLSTKAGKLRKCSIHSMSKRIDIDGTERWLRDGASDDNGETNRKSINAGRMRTSSRSQSDEQSDIEFGIVAGQPESQIGGTWKNCRRCGKPLAPEGLGTALKPANEPIVLARKPLSEKTVALNVLKWGTGALNIDGCRIETADKWEGRELPNAKDGVTWGGMLNASSSSHPLGRWPANVIMDGSDEVVEMFPETASGTIKKGTPYNHENCNTLGAASGVVTRDFQENEGSAARFFYTAKADSGDRLGTKHPTVKPVDLMQYLIRLVTPKGGLTLDPFAGTGTTAEAAFREGRYSVLIERETEYQADIRRRMGLVMANKETRKHEATKHKKKPEPIKGGSFFKARNNT